MAQQRGSATKILIAKESSFKVAATGGQTHVLPFVSESVRYNRNLLTSKTLRVNRNAIKPVRGQVDVAGDINFELSPEYGKLLHQVFGSYTAISGGGGGIHTFKIGDLPSFTMEKQFTDLATAQYFKYIGCKVNSFKFSVKPEGFIDSSVSILGAQEATAGTSFDANPTDLGIQPFDGFGCTIKQGGTLLGVATQMDLTIENNLDGNSFVIDGTGERHALPDGRVKVSGTLTALFEDMALYTLAKNNTETSLEIAFTNGTGAGTLGNEKLTFFLDEVLLKPQAPVVAGPQGVLVELPYEAYYNDGADATTCMAVLYSTALWYD